MKWKNCERTKLVGMIFSMTSRINCSLSLGLPYCLSRQCTCSNFSWFVVLLTNFHVLQIIQVFQLKENFETTLISLLSICFASVVSKPPSFPSKLLFTKFSGFKNPKLWNNHNAASWTNPILKGPRAPLLLRVMARKMAVASLDFSLSTAAGSMDLPSPRIESDFSILHANSPIFKPQVMLMLS